MPSDPASPLVDQRLRLFAFTASTERRRYLSVLRAFESARERYQLQLTPEDVAALLPADAGVARDDVTPALDQLHEWGVLARTQDEGRVRSIAEYRRRRSVYQMSELGWMAWQAVEEVLRTEPGEGELQKLVLPSVLSDLRALAAANERGAAEEVAFLLQRLHDTLSGLARRASRFHLAMNELASAHEADAGGFLEHKRRLLAHLDDFLAALQHHRPLVAQAVRDVEATGTGALVERAAAHGGPLKTPEEHAAVMADHWAGVAAWFLDAPGAPSHAQRLEERTSRAIRDLAGLLRRVTEARRGGVSRASQLELLARWFLDAPSDDAAHALFSAVFAARGVRHLSIPEADEGLVAPTTSWWAAPAVPVDISLRRHGRRGSPGRPAPVRDSEAAERRLRDRQARARSAKDGASEGLVQARRFDRELAPDELKLLLVLLSRALRTRRPAAGTTAGSSAGETVRGRVRVRVHHAAHDTVVRTHHGELVLPGLALEITPSGRTG